MMRIMFDTNAFDKIRSSDGSLEKIISSDKYEYYVTSVQKDEIENIGDEKKEVRDNNLLALHQIRAKIAYTPTIVGYARLGYSIVTPENDIYSDLFTGNVDDIEDHMIASAAKMELCTVVTDDKRFINRLKKHGIPTMKFDDFIHSL